MNRYLHRIQELEVQDARSVFFLRSGYFQTSLLPNLRVLKWDTSYAGTIQYIKPLLCPSLVYLDLTSFEEDERALSSFFRTLPSRCPGLTTIRVNSHSQYDAEFKDSLSQALCSFKNLKCVTVYPWVHDATLQHLFMSSKFEELCFTTDKDHLAEFSPPPCDIPFRNVKKLDLWLSNLCPIVGLLRPDDQKFHQVTIHLCNLELPRAMGSLFNGLSSRTQKSPLRSLRIDSLDLHSRENSAFYMLSFETFQPLTFLGNLRELSIQLENPISLSDEEVAEVARGWPLLEAFELCCIRHSPAKWITLKGLLLLAAVCPKLHHVGLTLDARQVPTEVPVPVGSQFNTITRMHFPNSPIENVRAIGKLLRTYFPSLTSAGRWERYRWGQHQESADNVEWRGVWEYLDYSRTRKDNDNVHAEPGADGSG